MKCPVCQSEGPEGERYCAECGAELPQPGAPPEMQPIVAVSVAPKETWCSTHLKGLFAMAIVLVVVLASVGLIYTQPWSKIKVIVFNEEPHYDAVVSIYLDGRLMKTTTIEGGSGGIVGVWNVRQGSHTVALDGTCYTWSNHTWSNTWSNPDGVMDVVNIAKVGPLYTKDLYLYLSTPSSSLTRLSVTDGVKLTFAPISVDTEWSDIAILLLDGTNVVQWSPATTDLDDGMTGTALYGDENLGLLTIYCSVTDIDGNGYINKGDYFTLTTGGGSFSSAAAYTCAVMYEPIGGEICSIVFTG